MPSTRPSPSASADLALRQLQQVGTSMDSIRTQAMHYMLAYLTVPPNRRWGSGAGTMLLAEDSSPGRSLVAETLPLGAPAPLVGAAAALQVPALLHLSSKPRHSSARSEAPSARVSRAASAKPAPAQSAPASRAPSTERSGTRSRARSVSSRHSTRASVALPTSISARTARSRSSIAGSVSGSANPIHDASPASLLPALPKGERRATASTGPAKLALPPFQSAKFKSAARKHERAFAANRARTPDLGRSRGGLYNSHRAIRASDPMPIVSDADACQHCLLHHGVRHAAADHSSGHARALTTQYFAHTATRQATALDSTAQLAASARALRPEAVAAAGAPASIASPAAHPVTASATRPATVVTTATPKPAIDAPPIDMLASGASADLESLTSLPVPELALESAATSPPPQHRQSSHATQPTRAKSPTLSSHAGGPFAWNSTPARQQLAESLRSGAAGSPSPERAASVLSAVQTLRSSQRGGPAGWTQGVASVASGGAAFYVPLSSRELARKPPVLGAAADAFTRGLPRLTATEKLAREEAAAAVLAARASKQAAATAASAGVHTGTLPPNIKGVHREPQKQGPLPAARTSGDATAPSGWLRASGGAMAAGVAKCIAPGAV